MLLITLKPFFSFFVVVGVCVSVSVAAELTELGAVVSSFIFMFVCFFLILRRVVQFLLSVALLQFAQ